MSEEDAPIELTDDGEFVHPLIEDLDKRKKRKGRTRVGRTIHRGVRFLFWIALILLSALGGVTTIILVNNKTALQEASTQTCTNYFSYLSGNGNKLLVDSVYYPQQTHVFQLLNYDGSDVQPIKNLPKQPESMTLSPDGKNLLYVMRDKDGESYIYVAKADGSDEKRVFSGIYPSWSPDNNTIAFIGRHKNIWGVYLISLMDNSLSYVIDGLGISDLPTWSADGKKLVLSVNRGVSTDLEMINIDGTNHQVLVKNGEANRSAVWSPDSQSLAFVTNGKLFILHLPDLKQKSVLEETLFNVRYPMWSADSKHIVVLANTQGQGVPEIFNISIGDGTYQVIHNGSC